MLFSKQTDGIKEKICYKSKPTTQFFFYWRKLEGTYLAKIFLEFLDPFELSIHDQNESQFWSSAKRLKFVVRYNRGRPMGGGGRGDSPN